MSIQQTRVSFSCSSLRIAPMPAVILIQQLLNTYCMTDIKWWYQTSKNLKRRGQKGVNTEEVSAVEVNPGSASPQPDLHLEAPRPGGVRPISVPRSSGTETAGGADAKPGGIWLLCLLGLRGAPV